MDIPYYAYCTRLQQSKSVFLSEVVQLMNQSVQWISKMFCICIILVKMMVGINLISASYLIKYAHHGRSCVLNIFCMPESILCIRALKFCFLRALRGHMIYVDIKDIILYIITSVSKNRTKIGYLCADHLTSWSLISHIVSDFNGKIMLWHIASYRVNRTKWPMMIEAKG